MFSAMIGKIFELLERIKERVERFFSIDGKFNYLVRKLIEALEGKKSGSEINELAELLEIPATVLKPWIDGIPQGYGYRSFKVPKKSGRGKRGINAPNYNLKKLQGTVYHKLLKHRPVQKAATAYVIGRSIFDNALPHVGQNVVINIDLKDFFGNNKSNRIYDFWRYLGWDVETSTILRNICCYEGSLPQGAPTSPALSNLCNQSLDTRLEEATRRSKGHYTRYSDDLTFSFPDNYGRQRGVLRRIHQILASEGYQIQKKKRIRIQRPHQRQTTTGLIVNEKVNLPRETRNRIRAMRHHFSNGTLPVKDFQKLEAYENLLEIVDKVNSSNVNKRVELNRLIVTPRTFFNNQIACNRKKILFLASSPANEARLKLGDEAREIDEGLKRSKNRDMFKLEQKWAVRTHDLRRALLDERPQIVHFCGHGAGEDGIVVQDYNGNSRLISTKALAGLFKLCSNYVECVLHNACFTELQAIAIAQHVDYVIGMSQAIVDSAAIEFSIGFYDALAAGESVEIAYEFGCNAIELENLPGHLIPQIRRRS